MKKILAFVLAVLVVASVCSFSALAAEGEAVLEFAPDGMTVNTSTTDEGFVYRIKLDGTAKVCGVPEGSEHVVVPSTVDGYTVTEFGAYHQRLHGGREAKSLTVPDTVVHLDSYVLNSFPKAEVINLPSSLVDIDYQNFFNDDNNVYYNNPDNWDNGVMYIGTNLMEVRADAPDTIVVREGTTCVAESAVRSTYVVVKEIVFPKHFVYGMQNLTTVLLEKTTVPKEFGVVSDYLFAGCEVLEEVVLEEGLTAIGTCAFRGCASLDEVKIPESVTYIGEDAFASCESLKQIYVPETVTSIDEHALGYDWYTYYEGYGQGFTMKYRKYTDFSIAGSVNSAAHIYAQKNRIPFVASPDEIGSTFDEALYGKTGDADLDQKINVKDATAIQKHTAGIIVLDSKGVALADADGNGNVNVKDATAVQKYVAGIETGFGIGEVNPEVKLYVRVYATMAYNWIDSTNPYYFYYYKETSEDMIEYPGVEGEFDALAGGWGALIPVDAKYVSMNYFVYFTDVLEVPKKDGMIAVPGEGYNNMNNVWVWK